MPVTTDLRPLGDGSTMRDLPTSTLIDGGDAGDRVLGATRALLMAFAVFTALAVVSLLLLRGRTETAFAWTIHSGPNASFLGAAYGAGFVLSVIALGQRRWSAVRVPVVTVTVFTVLTLIPTLLHLHKFHFMADAGTARLAAWVWLAVYLVVPIAGRGVIARQDREAQRLRSAPDGGEVRVVAQPMPAALVALLVVQGTALAAAGTVLFAGGATLHEPVDLERPGWAWPVMPLTSQAIGAWLLAFAVAIILAVRERDLSRMFVPALAYAAFGAFELAVVLAHGTAPGMRYGWWLAAALLFASLVPTGVYGAWAARPGTMPENAYRRSDVGFPAWRRTMARTSRAGMRAAAAIASVGSPWRAARAMTDSQRSTASRTSRSLRAVALSTSRNARSASLASASKSISLTPPSGV